MLVVVVISIIALLLVCLESRGLYKNGLKVAFCLLSLLGAIHYNYGNDYMVYYNDYLNIVSYKFDLKAIIDKDVFRDPGWAILCYAFSYVGGFFSLVAVLNIILNLIYYYFIRTYVDKTYWPLAVFIYVATTVLYLLNFSMMRQGLTIAIFLASWRWIMEKKWPLLLLLYFIASQIHSSASILYPFAFWGYISKIRSKRVVLFFIAFYLFLFTNGRAVDDLFSLLVKMYEFEDKVNAYENYISARSYGLGFLLGSIPFGVSLWYLYKSDSLELQKDNRPIVILSCLGSFIAPFADFLPMVGRLSFYFIPFSIATVPITYSVIRNKTFFVILISLFVLIKLYSYIYFFSDNSIYGAPYSEFHTIFEVL